MVDICSVVIQINYDLHADISIYIYRHFLFLFFVKRVNATTGKNYNVFRFLLVWVPRVPCAIFYADCFVVFLCCLCAMYMHCAIFRQRARFNMRIIYDFNKVLDY